MQKLSAPKKARSLSLTSERVHRLATTGRGGLLARLRIRKKLIVLHTAFSVALAVVLLLALEPTLSGLVRRAEDSGARQVVSALIGGGDKQAALDAATHAEAGVLVSVEPFVPAEWPVDDDLRASLAAEPGTPITIGKGEAGVSVAALSVDGSEGFLVRVRSSEARRSVRKLYWVLTASLLAVYGLVAVTLELFVLPQHVYGPIRRMQDADRAVQEGRTNEELIPEEEIPADELGDIMRLRNEAVVTMRRQERALAEAFAQVEQVANDLRKKNHLLEATRKNLTDADRLASLGMMSAGIAHEINTPLAVLKGTIERVAEREGRAASADEAKLLLRVTSRLERLSESLLDFARARPPVRKNASVAGIVEDAALLVQIDREASGVAVDMQIEPHLEVPCDSDRIVQVMVNLVRNAVDVLLETRAESPWVGVTGSRIEREGSRWVSITVSDNGPGIDPEMLPKLFEPFVSTRLDAQGTGLGLAVAEGIVDEHGGVILAGNRQGASGARFEVLLPVDLPGGQPASGEPSKEADA